MSHSVEYLETLSSPRWRKLKWRRLLIAQFKCERCGWEFFGRSPRSACKFFHLHHVTYRTVGEETLDDVRLLCPECHSAVHGKLRDSRFFLHNPPK